MAAVSAKRLEAHVRMLSETLAPRSVAHRANLDAAASYVAVEMGAGGAEVSRQVYAAAGAEYRNVIARLGPETEERVVVGAHYDAAGPFPGADDNASGVAGIIELVRVLAGSAWAWSWLRTRARSRPSSAPPTWGAWCTPTRCAPRGRG
ncbi:MAG TPA: M28 family peptidase [Longimicrobium sp.]|jgi:acetylornithine deacetylase/succinyl-diaminopimelate desuccinylase-like protein